MTRLLVSVSSLEEAVMVLDKGVSIIDLKHPAKGALGALEPEVARVIASKIRASGSARVITTTIGDLPMQPDLLHKAVAELADIDVDVIKIGFFEVKNEPLQVYDACLEALKKKTSLGLKLVAVLFAEFTYPPKLMGMLKNAGFYGVMLDTAYKTKSNLLDYMPHQNLQQFVTNAKSNGLQSGLAGSLKLEHISELKQFSPHYIGLRGGLCESDARVNALSANKVEAAIKML